SYQYYLQYHRQKSDILSVHKIVLQPYTHSVLQQKHIHGNFCVDPKNRTDYAKYMYDEGAECSANFFFEY
ncbi:hypothetical protein OVW19_29250, partial [Klebsiella pneumoniae]|nr:hypothetical protein [Klebsiella pneumoniae]